MKSQKYYEFFNQAKINSGLKALETIPYELSMFDAQKPLVLTSKEQTRKGLDKKLVKSFSDTGFTVGAIFDDISSTATIGTIRDLQELYKERGCDSIIALGSGPVVDTAKGLNILLSEETEDLINLAGKNKIKNRLKPFVTVSIYESTGTEITDIATIDKQQIVSDYLFPDIVIIDPRMVCCGTVETIINSSMTALAHSVEALTFSLYNPMRDSFAYGAIQFIFENLVKAVKNPQNKKCASTIANAAAMAGIAYSNSQNRIVHNLGNALSLLTNHNAGTCMGIILPYYLDYLINNGKLINDELYLAIAGFDSYCETPKEDKARNSYEAVKKLFLDLSSSIPGALKEMKIPEYVIKETAERAYESEDGLYTKQEYFSVLNAAYLGSSIS